MPKKCRVKYTKYYANNIYIEYTIFKALWCKLDFYDILESCFYFSDI